MAVKISTRGRYALRLMLDLALHDTGEYISLRDISARQEISVKYLEQIVTVLGRAGLVRSVRGPQGGYRLSKAPADYTAGEILRTIEGSLAPVACLDDSPNACGGMRDPRAVGTALPRDQRDGGRHDAGRPRGDPAGKGGQRLRDLKNLPSGG